MTPHDPHKWMDDTHWSAERDADDPDGDVPDPEPDPLQRDLFN